MGNFCGSCGAPLRAGQKFCPKCGTALIAAEVPAPSVSPRPPTHKWSAIIAVVVILLLVLGGAAIFAFRHRASRQQSETAAPVDLSSQPGSKFDVTYQPETVVIDPATTEKSFEGVSPDGALLVFNTSVPAIRGLRPGSVLLLQGLALKKVVAVEQHGASMIVATRPATLTDAIKDGHIHWDTPINFDGAGSTASAGIPMGGQGHYASSAWEGTPWGMAMVPATLLAPPPLPVAWIASPNDQSDSEGDWKFTTKFTKEAGKLNLEVDIKGAAEGMTVDVTGRGHIQSFGLMTDIQISHGVIEQFQYVAKNLRGEVTIDFIAAKSGDGQVKGLEIKLPHPFETPLPIGGIPFVLSIGETVIIKPALSGKNQMAEGHFKIRYGGGQGFSMNGPSMAAEGQPDGENEITGSSSVAIAPFAYILGMAMPRIELTLGLQKALGFDKLVKALPASIADRAADLLSKTDLGAKIVDVAKKTLKSEAAAHVEMAMVASHLESGPLVLIPCKKTTLDVWANVGYDANAIGKTATGSKELNLGVKQVIQQTPPNIRCGS